MDEGDCPGEVSDADGVDEVSVARAAVGFEDDHVRYILSAVLSRFPNVRYRKQTRNHNQNEHLLSTCFISERCGIVKETWMTSSFIIWRVRRGERTVFDMCVEAGKSTLLTSSSIPLRAYFLG